MAIELANALRKDFFELSPFNIAMIDKDYKVILANHHFENYFGQWRGKRCFEACKSASEPCKNCKLNEVFSSGQMCVSFETGACYSNHSRNYVIHLAPVKNENNEVVCVIEMSLDVSENKCWQRDYHLIFERVPNYITVIDRNYRIHRANENVRKVFGESFGNYCYEVYKKRKSACKNCPAALTFLDGREHHSTQLGKTVNGDTANYIVVTTPLSKDEKGVDQVIEICTDITELTNLQSQISKSHTFYESIISDSDDAIIAVDEHLQLQVFNDAAKNLLKWSSTRKPCIELLKNIISESFFINGTNDEILIDNEEMILKNFAGEDIPVRIKAFILKEKKRYIGRVAYIHDLRSFAFREKQKLDSDRLAAIAQTLTGLSHTVGGLLDGIDKGMNILRAGHESKKSDEILEGWKLLNNNFDKANKLVRDFLEFSERRNLQLKLVDPPDLIKRIATNFEKSQSGSKVQLKVSTAQKIKPFYLDSSIISDIFETLFNYSVESLRRKFPDRLLKINILIYQTNGSLIFEMSDNGAGIDEDFERSIFSSVDIFSKFSLMEIGLLRVRKSISEHGGEFEIAKNPGGGSVFRIKFSRIRIDLLLIESKQNETVIS